MDDRQIKMPKEEKPSEKKMWRLSLSVKAEQAVFAPGRQTDERLLPPGRCPSGGPRVKGFSVLQVSTMTE
jgi:hypothetical protein